MIAISKITQSTSNASLIVNEIKGTTRVRDASARIQKSALLDGGTAIFHYGFADGDRRIDIRARMSETQSDILWAIFKNETFINIATIDGFFYGVIEKCNVDVNPVEFTILIKE